MVFWYVYFLVYVSQVSSWFGLALGRLNLSIAFGMSCASRSVSHKAHKTLQLPINSFGFQKIPRCADAPFWKKSSSPFHVFLKTHMIQTDTVSIATAIIQHGWLWKSRCSTTRASPARKSTGTTNSMTEWGLSSWNFFSACQAGEDSRGVLPHVTFGWDFFSPKTGKSRSKVLLATKKCCLTNVPKNGPYPHSLR